MRERHVDELSEREAAFLDHLRRSESQGVSLAEYCRGRDLDIGVLYRIKQRLAQRGVNDCREVAVKKARALPPRFAPVRISPEAASVGSTACRIKHPAGWIVECASLPPPAWLSALMIGDRS